MKCPKCDGDMVVKTYGRKISLNRCSNCQGLFVKPDVLMEMKHEWMSEVLDMGDRAIGRKLNAVDDIDCPECGTHMDKVSDQKQTHIWYDGLAQDVPIWTSQFSVIIMLVIILLASLYPAWQASRIRPAEELRYE